MPSTYTPLLRLTLPADGELVGTWGQTVNNGITSLEEAAIAGTVAVPVTDGADTVLTVANGAADQARYNTLQLTGALTAQRNVIVPAASKNYFVRNATTGGFGVLVKTAGGAGVVVPAGTAALVYCDGVDVLEAITTSGAFVKKSGDTMTGALQVNAGITSGAVGVDGLVVLKRGSDGADVASFGYDPVVPAAQFVSGVETFTFRGATAEKMRINAAGNVGIGTNAPNTILHIERNTNTQTATRLQNTSAGLGASVAYIMDNGVNTASLFFTSTANTGGGGVNSLNLWNLANAPLTLGTNGAERMRIDAAGNVGIGGTSGTYHVIAKAVTGDTGAPILAVNNASGGNTSLAVYGVVGFTPNAANAAVKLGRDNVTGRSLNSSGTNNASGADYAEYEPTGMNTFAKGDVVGFDVEGVLTAVFVEAVRFGIKSTDPSYVGGDGWGEGLTGDALEAARQGVDRVAYSGKVPVNVLGALPGGYIVAEADADGDIVGVFVADADFEQYKRAVGRVNRILGDGRAEVAVIVH